MKLASKKWLTWYKYIYTRHKTPHMTQESRGLRCSWRNPNCLWMLALFNMKPSSNLCNIQSQRYIELTSKRNYTMLNLLFISICAPKTPIFNCILIMLYTFMVIYPRFYSFFLIFLVTQLNIFHSGLFINSIAFPSELDVSRTILSIFENTLLIDNILREIAVCWRSYVILLNWVRFQNTYCYRGL